MIAPLKRIIRIWIQNIIIFCVLYLNLYHILKCCISISNLYANYFCMCLQWVTWNVIQWYRLCYEITYEIMYEITCRKITYMKITFIKTLNKLKNWCCVYNFFKFYSLITAEKYSKIKKYFKNTLSTRTLWL